MAAKYQQGTVGGGGTEHKGKGGGGRGTQS